jgi:hypothetical protein
LPFPQAIATIRNAVGAILRLHRLPNNQTNTAIVGTAWCVVENRYLVTAQHVFNNEKPRDANDRFFVFSVPQNGISAYHVPVVSFPLEDIHNDMAIIEIDASANQGFQLQSVPVTFRQHLDGEKVLTYGFPAPQIFQAQVDKNLNWLGGSLFLKGHANEGIISGQFELNGQYTYELNVGWFQGESGGPIFSLDPTAAFAIMQRYRNVVTPHGTVPGPHQGRAVALIENSLRHLGATIL